MFSLIMKKSVLCTLLIGLVLSAQQTNAMDSNEPQASSGSSWVSVFSGVALSAVAALGLYSWHKHVQDAHDKEKEERHKKLTALQKHDRLLNAIKDNDLNQIKYWIEKGVDINYVNPLIQLGHGDSRNYQGNTTALSYALAYAKLSTLRLLLQNGAQVNMVLNPEGFSHLGLAAYVWPCLEKVQLLLSYGARLGDYDVDCRVRLSQSKRGVIPCRLSPLASRINQGPHLSSQAQAIHDCVYGPSFCQITARNDRQKHVNEVLKPFLGDDISLLVNQYLGNEDPSLNVG